MKRYLSLICSLILIPQPKAIAQSTFPGCTGVMSDEINGKVFVISSPQVTLQPSEMFNGSLETIGTQENPLPMTSPYKLGSIEKNIGDSGDSETVWRMRVSKSDFDLFKDKNPTYEVFDNQAKQIFNPTVLKAVPIGSIENYETCSDGSVLVKGKARLVFGEFSKWTSGFYGIQVRICVPNKSQC